MTQNFHCGKFKLCVFIDLSKAFDKVNHQILLKNIMTLMRKHCLLPEVIYFKKEQYIKINNDIIYLLEKDCGVPQWSIFRPVLFLVDLNGF